MSEHKPIPKHQSEDAERSFWNEHDSTDYIDWASAQEAALPNLKPSAKLISIRLPEHLLERIKIQANKRDIPYQSLMKVYLSDAVEHDESKLRVKREPFLPQQHIAEKKERE